MKKKKLWNQYQVEELEDVKKNTKEQKRKKWKNEKNEKAYLLTAWPIKQSK